MAADQPLPYPRPSDPGKRHSHALTDGPDRAGARAMLKAVGFTDDDLAQPIVGVATSWIETMPCNLNQRRLAESVKAGIREAGGTPMEFNTIAVSDGVSMGTEGMKASLFAARSSRTRSSSSRAATCSTGSCASSAATRRSRPGRWPWPASTSRGSSSTTARSTRARTRASPRTSSRCTRRSAPTAPARSRLEELYEAENGACPGAGACGGQFTANTMATVLRVPRPVARRPQRHPRRGPEEGRGRAAGGRARDDLVRHDIRPRTSSPAARSRTRSRPSSATGGTTNAALHLPAIAAEFGIPLTLDEFTAVADRTPLIADMRPGGRYAAADMYDAGGVGLVMRELLKRGPAPRRREDGRRPDDREDRRRHRRDAGPAGRPPHRHADQGDRRHHDPPRQPRARRLRPEARRRRAPPPPRPGPRVRLRAGLLRGGQGAPDRRGRRRRHPLRGPGRRARDAGDAQRHGRARRRRAWASPSRCSPTAGSRAARTG